MAKISFLGKVLPDVFLVTSSLPTVTFNSPDTGVKVQLDIKILDSAITIDCEIDNYKPSDLVYIYIRAFDLVRAAVNIFAFAKGTGFTVIIDKCIDDKGAVTSYVPIDNSLTSLCTAIDINSPTGYDEAFKLIGLDPNLFMALDDLIVSITLPHHSAVNCARAIEGIRQMIEPDNSGKPKWDKMHSALKTTKKYVDLITDSSKFPRHGNRIRIEGDVTQEIVKRSWIIMNRFLEYRKRGNTPLPELEFPILTL